MGANAIALTSPCTRLFRVENDRSVGEIPSHIPAVESPGSLNHALGGTPFGSMEFSVLVKILARGNIESCRSENLAKGFIGVQNLVIVRPGSDATRPNALDVIRIGMESVGNSDPQIAPPLEKPEAVNRCNRRLLSSQMLPHVLGKDRIERIRLEEIDPVTFAR